MALGCDQGTAALSSGGKGPPPQVVWQYPSDPSGGEATGVPLLTSIRVQFNRFLAPESAVRQAVCVESCTVGPSAQCDGQCIGGLAPEYDPVDRVAVWKNAALQAGLRYNVRLLVPQNDDDPTGIRTIDGTPLEAEYAFAFTAGDPSKAAGAGGIDPALANEELTVTKRAGITYCSTGLCSVPSMGCTTPLPDQAVFGPRGTLVSSAGISSCAGSPLCHVPPAQGPTGITVPVGSVLTLSDQAIVQLVANAVVATETAVGPDPGAPRRSPKDVFGVNMPYIDGMNNNAGNSYLLYKLILGMAPRCGRPTNEETPNPSFPQLPKNCTLSTPEYLCKDVTCLPDAAAPTPRVDGGPPGLAGTPIPPVVPSWVPEAQWQPPLPGEYDRLRTRIRGEGMPAVQGGMPYENALAVSAWIAAGATVVDCPP